MEAKAFIFDFDGVICDSVNIKTQAFAKLYQEYGRDIQDKVVEYHIKHGGVSRFEKIKYFHNKFLKKKVSKEELEKLSEQFSFLVKKEVIESSFIKGADLFINKYASVVPQYICTGTPQLEILEIMSAKKIDHLFKGIYGSPKNKIQIIGEILYHSGILASDFVYFGDALTDHDAALSFNMPFIGIQNLDITFPPKTNVVKDFIELL